MGAPPERAPRDDQPENSHEPQPPEPTWYPLRLARGWPGDLLVVGPNSDASVRRLEEDSRPVVGRENRASLLAGLACIAAVVIFDGPTPAELIRELEPDVLSKGGDYTPEQIGGADLIISPGGRIVTIPLVPGSSTTAILERRTSDR